MTNRTPNAAMTGPRSQPPPLDERRTSPAPAHFRNNTFSKGHGELMSMRPTRDSSAVPSPWAAALDELDIWRAPIPARNQWMGAVCVGGDQFASSPSGQPPRNPSTNTRNFEGKPGNPYRAQPVAARYSWARDQTPDDPGHGPRGREEQTRENELSRTQGLLEGSYDGHPVDHRDASRIGIPVRVDRPRTDQNRIRASNQPKRRRECALSRFVALVRLVRLNRGRRLSWAFLLVPIVLIMLDIRIH